MAASIYQTLFTYYSNGVSSVINTTTSAIETNLVGPIKIALIIYVIFYGVAVMTGQIREFMGDVIRRSLKLGAIYMLVANSSNYTTYVTNFFITALPAFTQSVSNSQGAANGTVFDTFSNFVADQAAQMIQNAQWYQLDVDLLAVVLLVAGYIVACIAFVFTLIPLVLLALLIAVGPIFIACALFEVTRRFFFGWLSECVSFSIISLLLNVLLSLVINSAMNTAQALGGNSPYAAFATLIATLIVAALMLLILPALAAGIAGGRGVTGIIPGLPGRRRQDTPPPPAGSGGGSASKS
jgi:type IV secretion system protein VirB6